MCCPTLKLSQRISRFQTWCRSRISNFEKCAFREQINSKTKSRCCSSSSWLRLSKRSHTLWNWSSSPLTFTTERISSSGFWRSLTKYANPKRIKNSRKNIGNEWWESTSKPLINLWISTRRSTLMPIPKRPMIFRLIAPAYKFLNNPQKFQNLTTLP